MGGGSGGQGIGAGGKAGDEERYVKRIKEGRGQGSWCRAVINQRTPGAGGVGGGGVECIHTLDRSV